MNCINCGTKNKEEAKFCKKCGQKLIQPSRASSQLRTKNVALIITLMIFIGLVAVVKVFFKSSNLQTNEDPTIEHLQKTNLPEDIENTIFEESTYAEPITLDLAGEDDPQVYEEYRTQILGNAPAPSHPGWSSAKSKSWLTFFTINGYAEEKTVLAQASIGGEIESKFLFYTKKINPYIIEGENEPGSYFVLHIADRNLLQISFTNDYEQLGERFYSVRFTYELIEKLPGLPNIDDEFEGSAEFYWDPSKGVWQFQGINLGDRGMYEYVSLINSNSSTTSESNIEPTIDDGLTAPEVVEEVAEEVVIEEVEEVPTETYDEYDCPDSGRIKLYLDIKAIVNFEKVNLRSSPEVPPDWDENIVSELSYGEKVTVVGGPKCAHNGTWWKVETEDGYIGWMRELTTDVRLLESLE